VKRWSILFVALLVGAAAPARAWCEATCLATAHQESAKPHCPSHEPSSNSPTMAAAKGADCPALESARPTQAKLDFAPAPVVETTRVASRQASTSAPRHHRHPRHSRHLVTPLRIWSHTRAGVS